MSAVLGGADSIAVAPFDECYKAPDEASRRLARNTQLLLNTRRCWGVWPILRAARITLKLITDFHRPRSVEVMQEIEAARRLSQSAGSGMD